MRGDETENVNSHGCDRRETRSEAHPSRYNRLTTGRGQYLKILRNHQEGHLCHSCPTLSAVRHIYQQEAEGTQESS